jgi:DNA-binding MarR family transcriptional regulator
MAMAEAPLIDLLGRLALLLRTEGRRRAGQAGLNAVQGEALAYLARANRYSDRPSAVAEFLGVSRGTASQTLKRLEERGLLRALADPSDGRCVHLHVTPKGRRVASGLGETELLEAALGASARRGAGHEGLRDDLEHLLRSLQRAHGSKTFGICRTCRHFRSRALGERHQCGLTLEPLTEDESEFLCREHEYASG